MNESAGDQYRQMIEELELKLALNENIDWHDFLEKFHILSNQFNEPDTESMKKKQMDKCIKNK